MYRNILFRWLPVKQILKDCLVQAAEIRSPLHGDRWSRQLSVSRVCCKKRRSAEEKAIENHGRRVIRYSPKAHGEVVGLWRDMTVEDIAHVLDKDVEHVLKALEFADKTSDTEYRADTVVGSMQVARDVVKICGFRYKTVPRPDLPVQEEESKDAVPLPPARAELQRARPPVVCVMGHVDHGKTSLLDALRHTRVAQDESGGITQRIGAFEVSLPGGESVTFLDTPGHAAFSAMRARGAHATDVVVLVVAADDGVMAQTVESVRMARDADVPILVAVNKIDKPGADIDRTLRGLASIGVVAESLGGPVQAVPVSAKLGTNLPALLEALVLQAQMMDLRACHEGPAEGVVLEAQLHARTGKQATVLVERGELRAGAVLVAGLAWAKVRALYSADGGARSAAGPSAPVTVLGWRVLPAAGDLVLQVPSERRAHEVLRYRAGARAQERAEEERAVLEERAAVHREQYERQLAHKRRLGRVRLKPDGPRQKMVQHDDHPTLNVVVKGDADGSVEALLALLDSYTQHDVVRLQVVHSGVGAVTPGDLELAASFGAVLYAFNVECPPPLEGEARRRGVRVRLHDVIYRVLDDVRAELDARVPPHHVEEVLGEARVLQQFEVSAGGGRGRAVVAGCRCTRGALARDARYRLTRNGEVLYDGALSSMKHLKQEVSTVSRDVECGLRFEDPAPAAQPGDLVTCYRLVEARRQIQWDPGF